MAHLREKVPAEFSDDERWYKYFTKKSLLALILSCGIAAGIIVLFTKVNLTLVGVVLGVALGAALFSVTILKPVKTDVLSATGATMDVVGIRVLARRLKGRVFVKMNDNTNDFEIKKKERKK